MLSKSTRFHNIPTQGSMTGHLLSVSKISHICILQSWNAMGLYHTVCHTSTEIEEPTETHFIHGRHWSLYVKRAVPNNSHHTLY